MLNTSSIVQRIQQLIQTHELNASSFAEIIGVQRSSISHILSGRNKPSLDFLARVEDSFDDVDFLWLLKGESSPPPPTDTPSTIKQEPEDPKPTAPTQPLPSRNSPFELQKIVHYYTDGSFEVYRKR